MFIVHVSQKSGNPELSRNESSFAADNNFGKFRDFAQSVKRPMTGRNLH